MPLTLENPVTLEEWQQILSAVDSATPFHDHAYIATVFSKTTGDDDDFVMINSISGGRAT